MISTKLLLNSYSTGQNPKDQVGGVARLVHAKILIITCPLCGLIDVSKCILISICVDIGTRNRILFSVAICHDDVDLLSVEELYIKLHPLVWVAGSEPASSSVRGTVCHECVLNSAAPSNSRAISSRWDRIYSHLGV